MNSSMLKYDLLSPFEKREVSDFIEFLFSRKLGKEKPKSLDYKSKILSVSTWSEEDIKVIESNNHFDLWQPPTW